MTLILDAGAMLAFEKGDKEVRSALERASRSGAQVRTTSGAVAQVWRGAPRQARLAMLLRGVDEVELTRVLSRRIGALLARAGLSDVVDGSIIDAATDGDEILTSDPDDMAALVMSSGKTLLITQI